MISLDLKNRLTWTIIVLVAFFSLFALWLRLLPMLNMGNADILSLVASDDPLYNLRQVEFLLANNLQYGWFEPMTQYPFGTSIYWGPLFPLTVAIGCLLTGATTRPEVIHILLIVPPLMGAATVAVMYYVGKVCDTWKTGLLASGFTAIVAGQFFYRSMYGYADHHIAEVLFSVIFCLFYMYSVLLEKDTKIDIRNIHSLKSSIFIAALAGVAYLLGLFVMPTMILFAMIVGFFTVVQFIVDSIRQRTSEYLVIINIVIFSIAIIGLLLFGLKSQGLDLSTYSLGHILAYLALIGGSVYLYIIQRCLKSRPWYFFVSAVVASAALVSLILFFASPQLYSLFISALYAFFGQAAVTETVQEARGWSVDGAWLTFSYGLLLMAGGILVMLYNNFRHERPEQVFAIVWTIVMLFSTWQHIRYEYYLAVNVALMSGVCAGFVFEKSWPEIRRLISGAVLPDSSDQKLARADSEKTGKQKKQKKTGKTPSASSGTHFLPLAASVLVVVIALLFIYSSVSISYTNGLSRGTDMNPDWKESAEWLVNNTPDTGVGYLTAYDRDTFSYPDESYGIMSWWDYGHIITTVGKRIPNANPFQQGVEGDTGSAAYFMSQSEDNANRIADYLGTRYIITDIEMAQGKFWAMATWYNATAAAGPYYDMVFAPGQSGGYNSVLLNKQPYYLSTVSRLHNFDGSMAAPSDKVYYIVWADSSITGQSIPVVTEGALMDPASAAQKAEQYNNNPMPGYHASVYSSDLLAPIDSVPALRHYRLVHESPTDVAPSEAIDLKYVKVFEYVKGAHIKGEGIIEIPLVTNKGRNFTYRQESMNGEFIVPYSTTGNPYDVKATGKYKITGSGQEFDVPESAVMQGLTIQ
ncbi:oligosaccharyl transferase, archaeosortase A system-associated [Methanoregula sp.]|uniref:oligosaccharyl transferase, archaeosortase A system-associated n=1 Tax=Methanoregula sp. TaxID=2052170 RepID=UPI000CA8B2D5|nr:oligosaccharyl transferase, archaeosortase A system-associated [Methanoregula sp.]PKG33633.1 MAG: oligosaccharyl transferase, archaeosortase A system-associated [Methanoregula sp.]